MKKIYGLVLGCLLSTAALAQTSSGLKFGVKAGVNFATMSAEGDEDEDLKSVTSFHVGGTVDIPVSGSFFVQPGLSLTGKGVKEKYSESESDYSYNSEDKQDIMYLEIPVNAMYKFQNFYIGAGPYAAFALSGKYKWEESETVDGVTESDSGDEDLKFGSGDDKHYKSTDFGLNVLAGYELQNGVTLGVNYGLGLSNISNNDDFKVKNRLFSISVGFKF